MTRKREHVWRRGDELEIPPAGDVGIREPREGWSPGCYRAVLWHYVVVRGASPRTALLHPSTVIAVARVDSLLPVWWPFHAVRRHDAPARIILSGDEPQPPV